MRWLQRLWPAREPSIRAANTADAPALAVVHASSFHIAWDAAEFERLLAERLTRALVATDGPAGPVVGFILTRGVAPETEILSVAVAPRWRRQGLARRLVDGALGRLAAEGYTTVFLEVEEGNGGARRLYERAGFHEIGRRAGYYRTAAGTPASAIVMRRDLT
ncbi:GNAT family N-acetyltransferase [Bosea sp. 117]|uniref:GNAT family N-acetyltransferase n=1 Tax=Bosea sp. 117 TaxID=1125973 RepID=UPI000494D4DE|nr:GNAT family N-acetyltransferase [Bosea sp. 117]